MSDVLLRATREIEALHEFFVDWFTGACPGDEATFEQRCAARFDDGFWLIPPAGKVLAFSDLAVGLRQDHGHNPDFRSAIRNVIVRHERSDCLLVTYEEWQRNAKRSTPPDNGRQATVVFDTRGYPHRLPAPI